MEDLKPAKKRGLKFLRYTAIFLILASVVYYFICGMTYSEGTRSGVLTKVSIKGLIFKTFEGELILGGMNDGQGAVYPAKIFAFSITDKTVYEKLEKYQGDKVVIHYKQVVKNFFWQGDTNYFVYEVNAVK